MVLDGYQFLEISRIPNANPDPLVSCCLSNPGRGFRRRPFKQPLTRTSTQDAKNQPFKQTLTWISTRAAKNRPFKQPLPWISTEAAQNLAFKQPLTRISTEAAGFGRSMFKTHVGCCLKGFGRGPRLYMIKKCSKRSVFDTIS